MKIDKKNRFFRYIIFSIIIIHVFKYLRNFIIINETHYIIQYRITLFIIINLDNDNEILFIT